MQGRKLHPKDLYWCSMNALSLMALLVDLVDFRKSQRSDDHFNVLQYQYHRRRSANKQQFAKVALFAASELAEVQEFKDLWLETRRNHIVGSCSSRPLHIAADSRLEKSQVQHSCRCLFSMLTIERFLTSCAGRAKDSHKNFASSKIASTCNGCLLYGYRVTSTCSTTSL